jgi:hypothetical protein
VKQHHEETKVNEFELRELLFATFEQMNSSATMYFTLVSAYLVVSFVAGTRLTRPQLMIINSLYILWVLGTVNTMYSMLTGAVSLEAELVKLGTEFEFGGGAGTNLSTAGFILVQIAGLIASLYFMWSVRHPRTDNSQEVKADTRRSGAD